MSIAMRHLGLADHGLPVSLRDFKAADFEEGYKYELIDGRLYVSPQPNAPENRLEMWLLRKLLEYADRQPDVLNYVTTKARVVVPGRRRATIPEPDIAAYRDFPVDRPAPEVDWRRASPVLVVEILYDADPYKDLVRNVELYLRVPSIREYWLLDARLAPDDPTLIVHRRRGTKWVRREYLYGETYATRLLPGFSLRIDPRR